MPTSHEIRKEITEQIVQALESNVIPWRRPWSVSGNSGSPANFVSKKSYSGINVLLTQIHALRHGFTSRWWGTFRQVQEVGGTVKSRPADVGPGHWGCRVVFYRPITKTVVDKSTGNEREEQIPLLRTYTIFNVDQCEGMDKFRVIDQPGTGNTMPNFQPAEELITACGADIRHGGDAAFYRRPSPEEVWPHHTEGDFIQLPHRERFSTSGTYYETAMHELAHWSELRTGWNHKAHGYAMGELAAELSAVFGANELHIPHGEKTENHAAYLKSWLDAM